MVAATMSIKTIASNEVLNRIETVVLLELHEKISISSLLNNAEAWDLLIGEKKDLEQIELLNVKSLFDLPTKTPTPAILHTLGLPYTTNRIKKKQLLFLHRLLNKDPNQQTRKMLKALDKLKVGWTKQVRSMLVLYQLPTDFTTIKNTPFPHWKNYVIAALEKRHKERLLEDCHKKEHGQPIPKTKTTSIIDEINNVNYK